MRKPEHVTFTGLDERTDVSRLIDLSSRYPVEWGILFSKSNQGKVNRYPSLGVISGFQGLSFDTEENPDSVDIRIAAHICGIYSNQIIERGTADIDLVNFLRGMDDLYRVQINVKDGETDVEGEVSVDNARAFAQLIDAGAAILQCTEWFAYNEFASAQPGAQFLYDTSGGAGVRAKSWPPRLGTQFRGYAGGIGPNTITEDLPAIAQANGDDYPYWIDMETNVRTDNDDWLDLDKCEAVLRAVYGNG